MNGNGGNAIEIQSLEMVYSDMWGHARVRALDGISFEVRKGEIFGFLGPNGAGKTTTIHILMNFIHPTRGQAMIHGLPVYNSKCREHVGFLPELFEFDKFLKGRKLLKYLGDLAGVPTKEIRAKGRELLEFFEMADAEGRKVKTYSKGMKQKIGLAQAMISDPDLLILDEPTSGMDPIAKSKIKNKFLELKQRGKTVFLSTHILSDVQQIADRVAIINKGKVIKIDTVENLLKKSDDTEVTFTLDQPKVEKLEENWAPEHKGNTAYSILTGSRENKARLIAKLSELGADIISVIPPRSDLEEIFMQLVENGTEVDKSDQQA
jgi:ABC-2 type transport system ATP-binding protein